MPTVRKPSSLAARNMRMAISLRLAANNFWIFFVFVITGANECSRETLYFHTSGPRCRRDFFNTQGKENLLRIGDRLESGGQRLGAHRLWRLRLQLLQLSLDFAPFLRLALGGIRRVGIGEKVQQLGAQIRRHVGEILLGELVEQLGVRIIVHPVFTWRGEFAYIEIVVGQLQSPVT